MLNENKNVIPFLTGSFSQWYMSDFVINKTSYNCCEQYMMAQKALLFKDKVSYKQIMESNSPATQKKLGRGVKNFDEKLWVIHRYNIILDGNYAKFS